MRYGLMMVAVVMAFIGIQPVFAQRMQMSPEQRAQRLKDSLSLKDDQAAGVLKIFQEMDQRRKDLFSSESSDRQSRMEAMRSLMDTTDARIEALLTAEQKTKYDAMKAQRLQRQQQYRGGGAQRSRQE